MTAPAKKSTKVLTKVPKKTPPKRAVSDLNERFALEYLKDLNASAAYQRCRPEVSVHTAQVNGWKVLQRPEVQAVVKAARDEHAAEAGVTVREVMDTLKTFMTYDARELFGDDGRLKDIQELTAEQASVIVGIKDTQYGREYKLVDKMSALDKAMKYHGLFEKDNNQLAPKLQSLVVNFVKPGGQSQH